MLKFSVSQFEIENDPATVNTLKRMLNEIYPYQDKPLPINGKIDQNTLLLAYQVSTLYDLGDQYGTVGINAFNHLAKKIPVFSLVEIIKILRLGLKNFCLFQRVII